MLLARLLGVETFALTICSLGTFALPRLACPLAKLPGFSCVLCHICFRHQHWYHLLPLSRFSTNSNQKLSIASLFVVCHIEIYEVVVSRSGRSLRQCRNAWASHGSRSDQGLHHHWPCFSIEISLRLS